MQEIDQEGGFAAGISVCDPVQDAITSTEIACRTAESATLVILQEHLKRLADLQYRRLSEVSDV